MVVLPKSPHDMISLSILKTTLFRGDSIQTFSRNESMRINEKVNRYFGLQSPLFLHAICEIVHNVRRE